MSIRLPEGLAVTEDGPVRILTIDRPQRLNAVNAAVHRGLATVWRELAADPAARAVVVTGAGGTFSAGGDLDWFADIGNDRALRTAVIAEGREILTEMVKMPLPVVAAVNGPAVGLGSSVALLCDIVLMADDAFLADPHVAVGLVAGDGGAVLWPLLTSLLRAKEYLFTGDRIPAGEAERIGLANRVLPADTVLDEATALAHRLAGMPAAALRGTKRALNLHLERAMVGVLDFALACEMDSFTTDEHRSAVARMTAR